MIGRLKGLLVSKQPPWLLLDVQGVGYEIEAPMSTFYELPATGSEVLLHTHLAIKEDAHSLYGFAKPAERGLFRSLIKVTGIGKKTAERLVVEMRDKVEGITTGLAAVLGSKAAVPHDPVAEATSALQALGYKPIEVTKLVHAAAAPGDTAEAIIRKALKSALRSG